MGASGVIINLIRVFLLIIIDSISVQAQIFFYLSAIYGGIVTFITLKFVNKYNMHIEQSFGHKQETSKFLKEAKAVYKVNWT